MCDFTEFIDPDEVEKTYYHERLIEADIESLSLPGQVCVHAKFFFSDLLSLRSYEERPWARHMTRRPALWGASPNQFFRRGAIRLVESRLFHHIMTIMLIAQLIWLAASGSKGVGREGSYYSVDVFFTIVFTIEMFLKIFAEGFYNAGPLSYMKNKWNWLDLFCNVFGWLKFYFGENYMAVFRTLRLVGPLGNMPMLGALGTLLRCLMEALSQLFEISLVLLFFFVAFAIMGIQLFSNYLDFRCQNILTGTWEDTLFPWEPLYLCSNNNYGRHCDTANNWHCNSYGASPWFNVLNFNNIGTSLLAVFVSVSRDGWTTIMFYIDDVLASASRAYFFILVVIGNLFLTNLVIALIALRFNRARQVELERQRLAKEAKDEENRIRMEHLKRLRTSKFSSMMDSNVGDFLGVDLTSTEGGEPNALLLEDEPKESIPEMLMRSHAFEVLVWTTTLLVLAALCANTYDVSSSRKSLISAAHILGCIVFSMDLVVRVGALGPRKFFSSGFNIVDTGVLACMFVEFSVEPTDGGAITIFGAMAALRLLRMIEYWHTWAPMQLVFGALLQLFSDLFPVILLIVLYLYIFSVVGMQQLMGDFNIANEQYLNPIFSPEKRWVTFNNFWWSTISVFQVMTGENWFKMMYFAIEYRGWSMAIFFVLMYISGAILLFAIMIAVLLGNFTSVQLRLDREAKRALEQNAIRLEGFPLLLHDAGVFFTKVLCLKTQVQNATEAEEPAGVDIYRPNKAHEQDFRARYERKDYGNFSFSFTMVHQIGRDLDEDERRRHRAEMQQLRRERRLNEFDRTDLQGTSCFCLWPAHPVRQRVAFVLHHRIWWLCMTAFVLLGVVLLGVREPSVKPGSNGKYLMDAGDILMTAGFLFEFFLKWLALGFAGHKDSYLSNPWNVIEFLILILHVTQFFVNIFVTNNEIWRVFQSLLALRALRVLTAFKQTRDMLLAVITTLPSFFKIVLTAFGWYLIFGVFGISLLAGRMRRCERPDGLVEYFLTEAQCLSTGVGSWMNPAQANFDDIAGALRTLYQLGTTDGWTEVMFLCIDATPRGEAPIIGNNTAMAAPVFIFVLVASFLFVAMFIALVVFTFMRLFANRKIDTVKEVTKMWLKTYTDILNTAPKRRNNDVFHENKLRSMLFFAMSTNTYEYALCFLIFCNSVIMAMPFAGAPSTYTNVIDIFDYVFLAIFVVEILLRIWVVEWKRFWSDPYDRADVVLLSISVVGFILEMVGGTYGGFRPQILRVSRMLRLVRVTRIYKPLQPVVATIRGAALALLYIAIVLFIIVLIYAYMGMVLYGSLKHQTYINENINFESFGNAIQLVFILATTEDWTKYMHESQISSPHCVYVNGYLNECGWPTLSLLYYISLSMVTTFILLNLFIAVLLHSFKATTDVIPMPITMLDIRNISALWSDAEISKQSWLAMDLEEFITFLEILPAPFGLDRSGLNPALKPQDTELMTFLPDCPVPVRAFDNDQLYALDLDESKQKDRKRTRNEQKVVLEQDEQVTPELYVHYVDAMMGIAAMRFRRTFGPNFDPSAIDISNTDFALLQDRYAHRFGLDKTSVVLPLTGVRAIFTIWGFWQLMKKYYYAGLGRASLAADRQFVETDDDLELLQRAEKAAIEKAAAKAARLAKEAEDDRLLLGLAAAGKDSATATAEALVAADGDGDGEDGSGSDGDGSDDSDDDADAANAAKTGPQTEAERAEADAAAKRSAAASVLPVVRIHNPSAVLRDMFLTQLRGLDPAAATQLELTTIDNDSAAFQDRRRAELEARAVQMADLRAKERAEEASRRKADDAERARRMGPQGAFAGKGSRKAQVEKEAAEREAAEAKARARAAEPVSPVPEGVSIGYDVQAAFRHALAMLNDPTLKPQAEATALAAAQEAQRAREAAELAAARGGTGKKKGARKGAAAAKTATAGAPAAAAAAAAAPRAEVADGDEDDDEEVIVAASRAPVNKELEELNASLAELGIASSSSASIVTAADAAERRKAARKTAAGVPAWANGANSPSLTGAGGVPRSSSGGAMPGSALSRASGVASPEHVDQATLRKLRRKTAGAASPVVGAKDGADAGAGAGKKT